MNVEYGESSEPLRVLIFNPLTPPARLIAVKILNGRIFGMKQLVDLVFLVFNNELKLAESFKLELEGCAFACISTIRITSDLPSVSDADVFCFITNFANPNALNLERLCYEEYFDPLYLFIQVAHNLQWPEKPAEPDQPPPKPGKKVVKKNTPVKEPRKPIFMTDGLVTLDILKTLSKNIPNDVFFCSTPIPAIAKSVLAEQLKVRCDMLNELLVWAANDPVFHVEFEKPLIIGDTIGDGRYDWDMVGKKVLASCNLDHTQFNEAWMKKDLINKSVAILKNNPYGHISKATEFAKALHEIWNARLNKDQPLYTSMGVISDGTLDTIKGYPCVFPIVFTGDSWSIRKRFEDDPHLKHEIKRINKAVKLHHHKVIPFCKKFLQEQFSTGPYVHLEDDGDSEETDSSLQGDSSWPASVSYGQGK